MASRRPFLVLAGGVALLAGCGSLQRPEIRAVHPHVTGIDLRGVNLAFEVDISNPYPISLRTPRFQYGVDIEDAEFIKSQAPVEVDLPAGKLGTVTLPVRLEYAELWRAYQSLAQASEIEYYLRGTIPISALGQTHELPLSHRGTFPVFRLPEIHVANVDFSDVSLSKARATVAATVRNPNVFALGADDLGYTLMLGDTRVGRLSAATHEPIPAGKTGKLELSGEITARSILARILKGGDYGDARVMPSGSVQTPFGPVKLAR